MIDKQNEIFTTFASAVRFVHEGVTVRGEYMRSPSAFPTVTLEEIENVTMPTLLDSSREEGYVGVTYRLQVFSNKAGEKRSEARAILATADNVMRAMGFRRVSYATTPEIYDSTIYSIIATYEAIVDKDGVTYKR